MNNKCVNLTKFHLISHRCTGEWTAWLNRDTPGGKGDFERFGKFDPVSDALLNVSR